MDSDDLIRAYWPMAVGLGRSHPGLPYDVEDRIGDATVGLVKAARRYDPSRGLFHTYARRRIVGEILDGQRARGPLTRTHASRTTLPPPPLSLDAMFAEGFDLPEPHDAIAETDEADRWQRRRRWVEAMLCRLPDNEAVTIRLRLDGDTLRAVGEYLKVSESRACQLEKAAVARLAVLASTRGL